MSIQIQRFITAAEKVDFLSPWTLEEWLCRSDIVQNEHLMLVRANMEAGRAHPFHHHPTREEIIYVISGRAELRLEDQLIRLEEGNSWVVPKGARHAYRILEPFTAVEASARYLLDHGLSSGRAS